MSEPIAYAAVAMDASESTYVTTSREHAEAACREHGWQLVPLYAGSLFTDEEREAVKLAADFLEDEFYGCSDKCAAEHNAVATLRKLLERTK